MKELFTLSLYISSIFQNRFQNFELKDYTEQYIGNALKHSRTFLLVLSLLVILQPLHIFAQKKSDTFRNKLSTN